MLLDERIKYTLVRFPNTIHYCTLEKLYCDGEDDCADESKLFTCRNS